MVMPAVDKKEMDEHIRLAKAAIEEYRDDWEKRSKKEGDKGFAKTHLITDILVKFGEYEREDDIDRLKQILFLMSKVKFKEGLFGKALSIEDVQREYMGVDKGYQNAFYSEVKVKVDKDKEEKQPEIELPKPSKFKFWNEHLDNHLISASKHLIDAIKIWKMSQDPKPAAAAKRSPRGEDR